MTGIRPVDVPTARAYRRSTYHAGGMVLRVGCRPVAGQGDAQGDRRSGIRGDIVFISAANPGGRRRPDGWNERMMARLAAHLAGVPARRGEGRLGRWGEPLFAARMPLARARVLARRFRQNALLLVRDGGPARLVFLASLLEDAGRGQGSRSGLGFSLRSG
ncbi:DUF3293 domain-containing protein [Nguyenibacter sp. L1]|uniref:DUF3293 domain-containing protein n=1 Tax=Nguyenibacter sp. L1 TaxID=3049350 RepID=UPI002B47EF2C|nr:DUF3293 domain-containing protein [Nguyenibacter sp. L1]WRH88562.1 DUF3293 domain-containing protein [Nguyenibacter sp. L1]